MPFFNLFDKKFTSPPVKTTVKSLFFFLYFVIILSISLITPFIIPEWMHISVELPIKLVAFCGFNSGNFLVNLWTDLYLISIPGEIAPPKYIFLFVTKSNVIHVPASIIKTFWFLYFETAAATSAILSTPNVFGVA